MAIDRTLMLSLDILRVNAYTRAEIILLLKRMEKELLAQVALGVTDWRRSRINRQLAEASAIISIAYGEAADVAMDTAAGIYQVAATDAAQTLAYGVNPAPVLPPLAMMETIAGQSIVLGASQSAWWAKQSDDVAFRFAAAVRQGLVASETNQQIIRRVRAEMEITRANAAALVQTSIQTVANDARLTTFRDNADIIKGLRWLATLDVHTCPVCGPRDGMTWTLEGKPLNAGFSFSNPPIHFNCRCVLIALTRFSGLGDGQRASSSGPVSDKINFSDWLETKGKAFQDDVLGPGRAGMYRAGKITLNDLVTSTNRPLTLAQLREKYA